MNPLYFGDGASREVRIFIGEEYYDLFKKYGFILPEHQPHDVTNMGVNKLRDGLTRGVPREENCFSILNRCEAFKDEKRKSLILKEEGFAPLMLRPCDPSYKDITNYTGLIGLDGEDKPERKEVFLERVHEEENFYTGEKS